MTAPYPTIPGVAFKDVVGFPGYCVGDDGSAWSLKAKGGNDRSSGRLASAWRRLKAHLLKGYLRVNLTRDGENCPRLVHQLVLGAFVGPCPPGMEGCHYPDPDRRNCRLDNLRWGTHAENMRDAYRDRPPVAEKACRRCGQAKLAEQFYRDKRASDGLKTECRACHKATIIATRDPEKKRAANREYMRRRRGRDA
jgi:hypothetical protein